MKGRSTEIRNKISNHDKSILHSFWNYIHLHKHYIQQNRITKNGETLYLAGLVFKRFASYVSKQS